MQLLINTGGKGKRLYPFTKDIPKPLVKILGKPVLHRLVDWAKDNEITEIIMLNGYLSNKIVEYFGDGTKFGIPIKHSNEKFPLGSGGPIKLASPLINGRFVYISGDHLCEVYLEKMLAYHKKNCADMTVLVHESTHPKDSDILKIDKKNRVIEFLSKHETHLNSGNLSNAGLCIIELKILNLMDKEKFNFENYIYPKALYENLKVVAYNSEEFMADMGTPERLKKCEDYLRNKLK